MTESTETTRRVFRYVVPVDDEPHVIPLTGALVAVAAVPRPYAAEFSVEFWAECSDGAPQVKRAFQVFGTGHPLPEDAKWVGTCGCTLDGLVWHLYELPVADPWGMADDRH